MTTASEYARNAAAALHGSLNITPGDFDVDSASAVIEKVIKDATRERESKCRLQQPNATPHARAREEPGLLEAMRGPCRRVESEFLFSIGPLSGTG